MEQAGKKLPNGMKSRKKTPHEWFELQDTCAYHALFDQDKVVWPDITSSPKFSLVPKGIYVEATAFMIDTGNKSLLAILNSRVAGFYMNLIAPKLGTGAIRYKKKYVEQLPIPSPLNQNISGKLEYFVGTLLENQTSREIDKIDFQIQNLIYQIYELSNYEIQILNNS